MDLRYSFSRLKKKVKRLGKRKPEKAGLEADRESIDPANLLLQHEPHVGAADGEGSGADVGGWQLCLDELEPVPTGGSENEQGAVVERRGASQRHSHLHLDVDVAVGGGSGRGGLGDGAHEEGEQFHSRSSAPSTPCSGEPDST